jgi:hypothetical protein
MGGRPMSEITIPGVPETITRATYVDTIESLGLDPKWVTTLQFHADYITATVIAQDETGRPYDDGQGSLAEHQIMIRVVE